MRWFNRHPGICNDAHRAVGSAEIVVGNKGRKETRERWIIKRLHSRSKWEKARHAYRVMEEVYRKGFDKGRYRVPEPLDLDPETLNRIRTPLPILRLCRVSVMA